MKLTEIRMVNTISHKRFSVDDFDSTNQQSVGFGEGGTQIKKMSAHKDPRVLLYALYTKDGTLLSCVTGYNAPYDGSTFFVILDVYTPAEYRQQGYATALYTALVKKYGMKLMSDKEQTPSGRQLWNGISKVLNVSVLDASTGTTTPRSQVSDDEIYVDDPNRYLLIAEQHNHPIDSVGTPHIQDGILEDYIIYTHPDNEGLYE